MEDISLNFRFAVNEEREEILTILKEKYENIKLVDGSKIIYKLNWNFFRIQQNENFDNTITEYDEDEFLYYKCNVDFYVAEENTLLTKQMSFAKTIKDLFVAKKIKCEIISEFEHLI